MEISLSLHLNHPLKPAFLQLNHASSLILTRRRRRRPFRCNALFLPCHCSISSPSSVDKAESQSIKHDGRRVLLGFLLSSSAMSLICDEATAVSTSRRAVHYVAKWKGITFMTSRQGLGVGGGTPYGFDIGQSERGKILKGLDLGVEGMRVGGQRLLIIPPELAYGSKGVQEIPPNATIEIDVELLSIKDSVFGSPVKVVEG